MSEVIRLLNNTRKVVTLQAFDGDTVDLPPTERGGSIEVDVKFDWQLPKGVKNLSKPVEEPVEQVEETAPMAIPDVPATPLKVKTN